MKLQCLPDMSAIITLVSSEAPIIHIINKESNEKEDMVLSGDALFSYIIRKPFALLTYKAGGFFARKEEF
jgi:hypothetical protein